MVSIKFPFGKKSLRCYIGYKDNEQEVPLCIMLPKTSGHRKKFDETKYMSFLIKDDELIEKYKIWVKVSNTIKKRFDIEPVYNEKYL